MQYESTLLSCWHEVFSTPEAGTRILLRVFDGRLNERMISVREFESAVRSVAGALVRHGVKRGDHVFLSLTTQPELIQAFWAVLWLGAVPCALFPEHGAEALLARFQAGRADVLITDRESSALDEAAVSYGALRMTLHYDSLTAETAGEPAAIPSDVTPDDPAFMVFTSGSTGFPKAVLHRHGIAPAILRSMRDVLGVGLDETYWCTAHPAWITGAVYGILGPVLSGVTMIAYNGAFHAKRWLPLIETAGVTTLYTAPSALRGLMRMDDAFYQGFDLSKLRAVFSVGEPLSGEVYDWGQRALGKTIYDTWFQSEAGTIRIANRRGEAVVPDWMGLPVDDCKAVLLDDELAEIPLSNAGRIGKLALRRGWESEFTGYYGNSELTDAKYTGDYYLTGDLAKCDERGRYHFIGRDDDLLNTSGHLLGPFEVEKLLNADAAVADAAVVSVPDPLVFEAVAAYIVLREGAVWDEAAELRVRKAVTSAIAAYAAPKVFILVDALPRNDAGKILRRELRARLRRENAA